MSNIAELMKIRRWCFWLDHTVPGEKKGTYKVSVVVENERGHFTTGGTDPGKAPWYWDEDTCKRINNERCGVDEMEANKIIASSMFGSV